MDFSVAGTVSSCSAFFLVTNALRSEGGLGEVSVVSFAIGFQTYTARWSNQIVHIKVSDKVSGHCGAVVVAEVSVNKQPVVK